MKWFSLLGHFNPFAFVYPSFKTCLKMSRKASISNNRKHVLVCIFFSCFDFCQRKNNYFEQYVFLSFLRKIVTFLRHDENKTWIFVLVKFNVSRRYLKSQKLMNIENNVFEFNILKECLKIVFLLQILFLF